MTSDLTVVGTVLALLVVFASVIYVGSFFADVREGKYSDPAATLPQPDDGKPDVGQARRLYVIRELDEESGDEHGRVH